MWRGFAADGGGASQGGVAASVEIGRVLDIGSGNARILLDPARSMPSTLRPASRAAWRWRARSAARSRCVSARSGSSPTSGRCDSRRSAASISSPRSTSSAKGARGATRRCAISGRGVTRFPLPGCLVCPAGHEDMRQIFAAEDRAHIEIGTVYPTTDVRAALYTDALLGRHFALVGSTGTGKSTSLAMILHRICEAAPEGHILMIDPHGEYPAAFEGRGELFDVDNLALPYWMMNFEEHSEIIVSSEGAERQRDLDVLGKCLLAARMKSRAAEGMSKVTVDSPIPYLLSDLINFIVQDMGKLDRAGDTGPYVRLKTKLDELRTDPRYAFMFSGMLVGDTMATTIARLFPPAQPGQADLDRRRVGRAIRDHVGGRGDALAAGVRLCDLVAPRGDAADPAGLRGSASLRARRARGLRRRGPPHPRARRQGGPQVRRLARPRHPAAVRSRRGRALAMRHDHRDAAQQRARPGACPLRDAGGCARLHGGDPGAQEPRMRGLRRGRRDPDAESRSTRSRRTSVRPRAIRSSRSCGKRPAAKPR